MLFVQSIPKTDAITSSPIAYVCNERRCSTQAYLSVLIFTSLCFLFVYRANWFVVCQGKKWNFIYAIVIHSRSWRMFGEIDRNIKDITNAEPTNADLWLIDDDGLFFSSRQFKINRSVFTPETFVPTVSFYCHKGNNKERGRFCPQIGPIWKFSEEFVIKWQFPPYDFHYFLIEPTPFFQRQWYSLRATKWWENIFKKLLCSVLFTASIRK